ncbi:MAG: hypothetical protein HYS15_02735 [Candidatus Spechtbacteria bacterium]|nr:hypothetical protein [Candidatus Spechtbacteria bacterium]
MKPENRAIIKTLAFYDALGHTPLTALELYRRLLRPEVGAAVPVSFGSFFKKLSDIKSEYISASRGFYFLKENVGGYRKRVQIGKTGIAKWRIARRMIRLISFLPFVRMVGITGSLALHMTNKESDIDVLIVTKHGHIWAARIFVSFFMQIFGYRRHGSCVRDRICLNHYVSDSSLILRPQTLFSAHICATFLPVWSKYGVSERFLNQNNKRVASYFYHERYSPTDFRSVKEDIPLFFLAIRCFFEFVVFRISGRFLEFLCRKVQAQRIRRNMESMGVAPGAVIFDDEALVFHHPRPASQEAMVLYEQHLGRLGFKQN